MKTSVLFLCALTVILASTAAAPEGRIAGGDDAVPGQIPYQAALSIGGSYNCGAIIISERYALTTMSCVCSAGSDRPWSPQLFRVNAGSVDLYSARQSIVVEKITINPNYSDFDTGIALLKLREAFVFSETVQAIPMTKENPPVGVEVEISGWGRVKEGEENMHRNLQIDEATVVEGEDCYRHMDRVDDQVICLAHPRKHGICRGDVGGPAVYRGQLVGMAASLLGECGSMLPDVFISIAHNYDWIVEHME